MRPEERFSKILFGVLLILAFFVSWGKWLVLGLGIVFLISAAWGICWTCKLKKFLGQRKVTIIKNPRRKS
jgi:hypothetical protein